MAKASAKKSPAEIIGGLPAGSIGTAALRVLQESDVPPAFAFKRNLLTERVVGVLGLPLSWDLLEALAPKVSRACLGLEKANLVEVVREERKPVRYRARAKASDSKVAVAYGREKHAAHTGGGTGWDLERWVYAQPERLPIPAGVPADAEYHSGFVEVATDAAGARCDVQHWTYYRKAPLSPERCAYCPA